MIKRIFAVAALLMVPSMAMADDRVFSAEDVEKHFKKGVFCDDGKCSIPKRGVTRKVCIGTDSKCAEEKAAAEADPGAFDMLITFDLGSDRLSDQARKNLAEFAKALTGTTLSSATFNIDGHTDARGSDNFNKTLSDRRASAVVEYLESLGISRERLTAKGHGEAKPRVDDPFAAINRRVEATLRIE